MVVNLTLGLLPTPFGRRAPHPNRRLLQLPQAAAATRITFH
jgi:hypothetical protein